MTSSVPANLFIAASLLLLIGATCVPLAQTPSGSQIRSLQGSQVPTMEVTNVQAQTRATLNLSGQGLTKLPSSVLDRTNLEELDISNNELTSTLPAEIRFLKNLTKLDASYNEMTGVPAEIGQLTELEELNLSYNLLTGLPYELGNLKKLKVLNLKGNKY